MNVKTNSLNIYSAQRCSNFTVKRKTFLTAKMIIREGGGRPSRLKAEQRDLIHHTRVPWPIGTCTVVEKGRKSGLFMCHYNIPKLIMIFFFPFYCPYSEVKSIEWMVSEPVNKGRKKHASGP